LRAIRRRDPMASRFLVLSHPGAMTLIQAESRRTLQPKDVATFQALARLAGQAVENGQLYRDATDLNRDLEAKISRRTAELQEALRDLDDYASSVAHDLKAPLRAIQAFTEALAEEFGDRLNDQGKAYVGRICGACARLDVFISDLLALVTERKVMTGFRLALASP